MTTLEYTFRGDNANLIRSIEALLELDAEGALVPHGVGGHARALLSAAAVRLAAQPTDAEVTDAMDTLVAVLNAIGYTEEFAEAHPTLKVSEGVKLFLSEQGHIAYRDALDALLGSYEHLNEVGGAHAQEMLDLNAEKARALLAAPPSKPVDAEAVANEQEAFTHWLIDSGQFGDNYANKMWKGWEARAALDKDSK
jgi:hypothetical protein